MAKVKDAQDFPRGSGFAPPRRFIVLELLRGLAATLVVLHHQLHLPPVEHCYLAVDFFFILSGFVMAHAYDGRLAAGVSATQAMRQRIKRLWPTMAAGIAMGALAALVAGDPPASIGGVAVQQFVFMPVLSSRTGIFPLDGVQWSLMFELIANAVHFTVLRRLSTRHLAACVVVTALLLFSIAAANGTLAIGDRPASWLYGFVRIAFPYCCGLLMHRVWSGHTISVHWLVPALLLLEILLLTPPPAAGGQWWADPAIVVFALPAIVWFAASSGMSGRAGTVAVWYGRLSYPAYAFHLPLISFGAMICQGLDPALAFIVGLSAFVAVFACAALWALDAAGRSGRAAVVMEPVGM